jgi:hypothetical protein
MNNEKRQTKGPRHWPSKPRVGGSNPSERAPVSAQNKGTKIGRGAPSVSRLSDAARSQPVPLKDQPLRAIRAEFRALWRKYLQAADPADVRMLQDELERVWRSESSVVVARKRREVRS